MKSGAGVPASSKKDPFGSLVDIGSKSAANVNSKASSNSSFGDFPFGSFFIIDLFNICCLLVHFVFDDFPFKYLYCEIFLFSLYYFLFHDIFRVHI